MLENPGNNIDRQTGLFNHGAFLQYTKQLYDYNVPFAALAIVLEHTSFKNMRTDLEREVIAEAVNYLSSIPNVYVFKNTGTEILMIFPEMEKAEDIVRAVRERFETGWSKNRGIMVNPYWIYLSDSSLAEDAEDLLYLIRYVVSAHFFHKTAPFYFRRGSGANTRRGRIPYPSRQLYRNRRKKRLHIAGGRNGIQKGVPLSQRKFD